MSDLEPSQAVEAALPDQVVASADNKKKVLSEYTNNYVISGDFVEPVDENVAPYMNGDAGAVSDEDVNEECVIVQEPSETTVAVDNNVVDGNNPVVSDFSASSEERDEDYSQNAQAAVPHDDTAENSLNQETAALEYPIEMVNESPDVIKIIPTTTIDKDDSGCPSSPSKSSISSNCSSPTRASAKPDIAPKPKIAPKLAPKPTKTVSTAEIVDSEPQPEEVEHSEIFTEFAKNLDDKYGNLRRSESVSSSVAGGHGQSQMPAKISLRATDYGTSKY